MVYDYETNKLNYITKDGLVFDLSLRGSITLISGASATGKTLLFKELENAKKLNKTVSGVDVDNIYLFTYGDDFKLEDKKCLVIIDRGEKFLTDDICEQIVACDNARFLIFTRGSHDLYVSIHQMGELKKKDGKIVTDYQY